MKLKLSLVLFLALVAVPLVAANSIDFSTGVFQSGTLGGSFSNGGSLDATIVGSLNTIEIKTGTLVQFTAGCPSGSMCFSFSGGSAAVDGTVFTDSISGGLTIHNGAAGSISATLSKETGVSSGDVTATFAFAGMKISSGSEDLAYSTTAVVPEPSSLLLLGSGLVGIVGAGKFRKHYGRG